MIKVSEQSGSLDTLLGRLRGVRSLGGGRWVALCPAHDDRRPSLSIRATPAGRILLHCFAGCATEAVLEAIGLSWHDLFACRFLPRLPRRSSRGPYLSSVPPLRSRESGRDDDVIRTRLWQMWDQAVPLDHPQARTARLYLAKRGLRLEDFPDLPKLRFHPKLIYREGGIHVGAFPALLAMVEHPLHGLVALHRTYLSPEGTKAPVTSPRKLTPPVFVGATRGAAIRLFPLSSVLVVAEGIETALSAAKLTGLSAWASVSAGGLEALMVPQGVNVVLIAADHDSRGLTAALNLAERLLRSGLRVRLAVPPYPGNDWNDVLIEVQQARPTV